MTEPKKTAREALESLIARIQGKRAPDQNKRILDRLRALQSGPRVIGGLDFWMAKQNAQKESMRI